MQLSTARATPWSHRSRSGHQPAATPRTRASGRTGIPCQDHDAELWFAERSEDVELAKSLCTFCPLRQECLAGALERAEPWGVWGGELLDQGRIRAHKRGRGRPRKDAAA